jgi:hypothetical protein
LSSRLPRRAVGANPDFCLATLDAAACAAFIKESRMELASAANTNRKSGEAEGPAVRPDSLLNLLQ